MISNNAREKALQEIEVAKEAVQDSYIELREAINQLSDKNGHHSLEEWMQDYANHFQKTNGIKVKIDLCQVNKIDVREEQRLRMTRVVQEIFNNIRKHSHPKNIWLNYQQTEQIIKLSVADDGVGFDPAINHKRKYHGNSLMILKERIASIQGVLFIKSSHFNGTIIKIEIPLTS